MLYGDVYQAVAEHYDPDDAWEDLVTVGSREMINLADESLTRHADSNETGLRVHDFATGTVEERSFAELDAAANRVANYLVRHTERNDRIGIMLPPSLELYASVFGTLKSGRIWVPLDVVFGPDALTHRARDAALSLLLMEGEQLEKIDPGRVRTLDRVVVVDGSEAVPPDDVTLERFAEIEAEDGSFDTVATHPDDVYKIGYTSGTTGQPKGLPATHGGLVVTHHAYVKYVLDLKPADRYFVAASPAWGYGSVFGTVIPGMVGTAIGAYREPFDPKRFVETLVDWEVSNAFAPPTALRQLRASDVDVDASEIDLRVLVTAGEALDGDTARWCRERLGAVPLDAYGATEVGFVVCNYSFDDWEGKPGSVGKPLPGLEVGLLDENGDEVGPDEIGEISVKRRTDGWDGGNHWRDPEAALDLFQGPWLRVGDLASRDEDGFYWYYARKDSTINTAGHRVSPVEVEETLMEVDGVDEVGVVGIPDETRGERIKAFVALGQGKTPSEEAKDVIATYARSHLSKHAYPREIEFLSELPKTATGKIKRRALEQRESSGDGP